MRGLLVIALLASTVSVAQGQDVTQNRRQGFWISAGVGAASENAVGTFTRTSRTSGPSLFVRGGGSLTPRLLLGGQIAAWANTSNDESLQASTVDLDWYPGASPFYLRVGIGGLRFRPSRYARAQVAPAGSVGVGYEIRVSAKVSITPFANGFASIDTHNTDTNIADAPAGNVRHDLLQIGIGITSR